MSILVDNNTRLLVQGITGREGTFHTNHMIAYGTNVVAGVTPGKGGMTFEGEGAKVPVFNTVQKAVEETGANSTVIFVPARFAVDAIFEAADAGIELIVCLTEYIPVLDMMVGDGGPVVEAQHHPDTHGFPHNHLLCIQQQANQCSKNPQCD